MASPQSTPQRLGRYELVRKIAAGGMAEIFLARQWGAGGFFHDVVIKRLFRHLAEHPSQLRMFQDEGRLLSALNHPNIPQVYEVGFEGGYWFIAMELVEGYTLADAWQLGIRNQLPIPLPVSLGVVMQTCEALHHAHERTDRARRPLRIVHRDVNPQNLMVTRDGVAKLMDFGVALTAARKDTEAGAVRGTFSYMAPEQIRARPLDKRADVFALGVILYELTTGTRLFRGSDVQIMTQVVEQDVPPPSSRVAGYPPDLEEIVLQALARDRGRRFPSTAHFAQRIEELAHRHGLLIGPRSVARWVGQVLPAERVEEAALSIVQPVHAPPAAIVAAIAVSETEWADGEDVEIDPGLDDEGLLDDLQLLSLPPEAEADPLLDAPESLDLPAPALSAERPDSGYMPADSDLGLDDLLGGEPEGEATAAPEPLLGDDPLFGEADDFEDGGAGRPVVLLGTAKKRADPSRPGGAGNTYLSELERRLEGDDPETPEGQDR